MTATCPDCSQTRKIVVPSGGGDAVFARHDVVIDGKVRRCAGSRQTAAKRARYQPTAECEEAVIEKIRARRDMGRRKYGTTMERLDLCHEQWLVHAQEEAMDLAIYLERCIREINK